MNITFQKARKSQAKARVANIGPSGSGKTLLGLFTGQKLGSRIAVIDTENGSASKYADRFDFDVLNLNDFDPRTYIAAMQAAVEAGYDVIFIDSLSPAWDRTKQLVDEEAIRSKSGNSFQAWGRVGTPIWNSLLQAIVQCPAHVIVTMRSKTEYVVEQNEKGKATPRKVGTAPQVRDGAEYEFDVVLELDADHRCWATKTRCLDLDGQMWQKDDGKIGEILRNWLSDGDAPIAAPAAPVAQTPSAAPAEPAPAQPSAPAEPQVSYDNEHAPAPHLAELAEVIREGGWDQDQLSRWKLGNLNALSPEQAAKAVAFLKGKLNPAPTEAAQ
ncbi:MAG: ATP-binding protein [Parvularcula sp.]|jgi:hypothetical protein|nr:ATP-binding protein [Parvularcula sp.]